MSTATQTCDITIPGYTLAERIGSGGYAEVWRAEAPGGIEKAVKVVYGFHDDEFASQELKALERIKGVRHPFLLSLERFEIVGGRLVILTELADMSLDQRRRQCVAEGLPGIPREELLRYMADTAEALDFLSQRHNLLHLDIKPENLLVLGDHIKVADFGLVKELATRTQNSLVSGMTPTYAAPEMFDDEPSAQSDQYSLAIVFQEMLSGALPFPGRTPAQLAKQHTQAEPQLLSLPAEDRPMIARALAKKPGERFPTCRAFVDALLRRPQLAAATPQELPRTTPVVAPPTPPKPDDTKPPSFCTTIRRPQNPAEPPSSVNVTRPVQRQPPTASFQSEPVPARDHVPESITDVAVPEPAAKSDHQQPILYLATGGVGIQALCRLRTLQGPPSSDLAELDPPLQVVALDTNRDELRDACSSRWKWPLSPADTLHLPLRLPKDYDDTRDILGWVSRRWLYNIPRSLETRGYRPLGRVALVDHARQVRDLLANKIKRLAALADKMQSADDPPATAIKVVLLTGTGGGTGAGMAVDLANAVRSIAADASVPVEIHGYFVCTCFTNNASSPLVAANTYSLLVELNHASALGNRPATPAAAHNQLFESDQPPFDFAYWLPATAQSAGAADDTLGSLARYLVLEKAPAARGLLRACRQSPTPREQLSTRSLTIKKCAVASLADQERLVIAELAKELAFAVQQHWLANDDSADWERLVRDEQVAALAHDAKSLSSPDDAQNAATPATPRACAYSPLALRRRFRELLSLEFVSETLFQIQRRLDARDDRGRPLLLPREANPIADAAREALAALIHSTPPASAKCNRFHDSTSLRPLIALCSRRILCRAIDSVDHKQPDRALSATVLVENLTIESQLLLDEALTEPDFAADIVQMIDVNRLAESALATATVDFLQCGHDRRTLLLSPKDTQDFAPALEKLSALRPTARSVPAEVDQLLIVSEEAGILPSSLALGLERVFPGIADAARRLFTRIDIAWQDIV